MKTYKITVTDDLERNFGHRVVFEGLPDDYGEGKPDAKDYDWLFTRYDYDKEIPPFWSSGIAETRCFTLPFAIYLLVYDLCQMHQSLVDGDEFVLEYEGKTYRTIVNTWPRCDEAQEVEKAFRELHKIPKDKLRD